MNRLHVASRFVALWLTVGLALPAPLHAGPDPARQTLRAMSAEGAGLEELRRELAPASAGLEEKGAVVEEGTRIVVERSVPPGMKQPELRRLAREISREIGVQLENAPEFQDPSRLRVAMKVPHVQKVPLIGLKEDLDLLEQATAKQAAPLSQLVLNFYEAVQNTVDALADRADEEGRELHGRIEVVASRDKDALVVEITDNGIGIPKIFGEEWLLRRPFTTKEEGTRAGGEGKGLALYGSRLIRSLRGTLEFDTQRFNGGSEVADSEKGWRLIYDPSKDDRSKSRERRAELMFQFKEGEFRAEPGTTVRWRFPAAFLPQAGLEEVHPLLRPLLEAARRRLEGNRSGLYREEVLRGQGEPAREVILRIGDGATRPETGSGKPDAGEDLNESLGRALVHVRIRVLEEGGRVELRVRQVAVGQAREHVSNATVVPTFERILYSVLRQTGGTWDPPLPGVGQVGRHLGPVQYVWTPPRRPEARSGLEEPVPYDRAILIEEDAYVALPSRVSAAEPPAPGAWFLPVPAAGIRISRAHLSARGTLGFLVFNGDSGGERLLRIRRARDNGRSLQVLATLLEEGVRPRRQWLKGTPSRAASFVEDGIGVQVTTRGVVVRPEGNSAVFLQRNMTPAEGRLDELRAESEWAMERGSWTRLRLILERVNRMKRKWLRSQQSPWARRSFDLLEMSRMSMLMRRRMPDPWFTGEPIPASFEKDLWKLLESGQAFLGQSPAPEPEHARTVRTIQAQAVMYMAAAGRLTDRSRVEYLLTDPRIPKGHIFLLLYNLWMNRALNRPTPDGKLDFAAEPCRRALAYALLQAAMPAGQFLDETHYGHAPDALLAFLPGGLSFGGPELERSRQAVRRVVSKQLWDPVNQRTGEVPLDLVEESLMPYPASLQRVAIVASQILAIVSDELGIPEDARTDGSEHFRRISVDLERQLAGSVGGALPIRLDVMGLIRTPHVQVLADGLGAPDEVIQWLWSRFELLRRSNADPIFDPEWILMDFRDSGAHWLNLGPALNWTEEKIHLLRDVLSEYGGPYRIQLRETRQRRDGIWVRAMELEIAYSPGAPPHAGLEEMQMGEFLERNAAARMPVPQSGMPAGARRAWTAPLPSRVNVYAQGNAMATGLEERFREKKMPGVDLRVFAIPLAAGQGYERPGVVVKDAALDAGVENPLRFLMVTLWLSDLSKVEPAQLMLAALGGLQDPSVQILGWKYYQNAQGQAMLVVFA